MLESDLFGEELTDSVADSLNVGLLVTEEGVINAVIVQPTEADEEADFVRESLVVGVLESDHFGESLVLALPESDTCATQRQASTAARTSSTQCGLIGTALTAGPRGELLTVGESEYVEKEARNGAPVPLAQVTRRKSRSSSAAACAAGVMAGTLPTYLKVV